MSDLEFFGWLIMMCGASILIGERLVNWMVGRM